MIKKDYKKSNSWNYLIEFLFIMIIVFGVFINPNIWITLQALKYYQEGKVLIEEGRYEKAIEAFDLAIKHRPNFPQAWTNKVYAQSKLGRCFVEGCFKFCTELIRISSAITSAEAWNCKGLAYSDLKQYEQALKEYNQAIAVNPKFTAAWYNKGEALLKLGRYKESISATRQVLKLEPDNHLAWRQICQVLYYLEQYQDAKAHCEESLNIQPDNKPTQIFLEKIEEKLRQKSFGIRIS